MQSEASSWLKSHEDKIREKLELEQVQMAICDDSQRLILPDKWVRQGNCSSEINVLENNIFCLKSLQVGLDSFTS